MSRRKPVPPPPEYPKSFETFTVPGYWLGQMQQGKNEPSCFNGVVHVRRYRITAEVIDEPQAVIAARIQALWDTCDNMHHIGPLRDYAAAIGYELRGEIGSKRKRRRL